MRRTFIFVAVAALVALGGRIGVEAQPPALRPQQNVCEVQDYTVQQLGAEKAALQLDLNRVKVYAGQLEQALQAERAKNVKAVPSPAADPAPEK